MDKGWHYELNDKDKPYLANERIMITLNMYVQNEDGTINESKTVYNGEMGSFLQQTN
jgi:hypothetical protein